MTNDQLMRWREAVGAMPASNDAYLRGLRRAGDDLAERLATLEAKFTDASAEILRLTADAHEFEIRFKGADALLGETIEKLDDARAEILRLREAGQNLLEVVNAGCGKGDYWHERKAMAAALKGEP